MTELPFVIGAGLGRTGSNSLRHALNQLGYKTFHMQELLDGKSDATKWFALSEAKRKGDKIEANKLAIETINFVQSQGYNATTDFPACLLYMEQLTANPGAKFILSVRSDGDAWAKSVKSTIARVGVNFSKAPLNFFPFFSRFSKTLHPWLWEEIGYAPLGSTWNGFPTDDYKLAKAHDDWIERVKATVPKEKLLVHQSADGFGPICIHLGIPNSKCPKEYPHVNDTASFKRVHLAYETITIIFWPVVAFFVFLVLMSIRQKIKPTPKRKNE